MNKEKKENIAAGPSAEPCRTEGESKILYVR